jgi:hypothetical protein
MTEQEYKTEYKRLEQNYKDIELKIENLTHQIKKEHLMRRRYYALESFIETQYQDLSIIKSFFGLVLMMGKNHVRYVIDDTFSTIDDLHHQIDTIKTTPSVLEGTYFDYQTKENIYYEVTIHEGN